MYFHIPYQTFGANLCYYIKIYKLHFCSKFSPTQGIQTINYRFFHSLFTSLELKIEFWAPTLYRHIDRCTDANDCIYMHPSNPVHPPYPQNSSNMIEIVSKWGQTYGTFMYECNDKNVH